jgi:predicted site-specific integrase-resolvase
MNTSRTWTTKQLCELFQCKEGSIYRFVRAGRIVPFKRNPLTFSDDEVQRFMQIRKPSVIQGY